jgi:hypothetical protein
MAVSIQRRLRDQPENEVSPKDGKNLRKPVGLLRMSGDAFADFKRGRPDKTNKILYLSVA